jgi:hypothetical protein
MNNDQFSFGWAIVIFYHPNEWNICKFNPSQRMMDRFKRHKLDKIKYPVEIGDIPKIEDQLNVRINVFTFADSLGHRRHSLYISKNRNQDEVNLFYWEGRFAWIKFLSRLFHDINKYVINYIGKRDRFI